MVIMICTLQAVSVLSFNEWNEGTQIEPATNAPPKDAYSTYGALQSENFYLEKTLEWAASWAVRDCTRLNETHWVRSRTIQDWATQIAADDEQTPQAAEEGTRSATRKQQIDDMNAMNIKGESTGPAASVIAGPRGGTGRDL